MGDLTTGYTFASGERVTHTKLNQLVNNAVLNAAFLTGKSPASAVTPASDAVLIYSYADGGLRKTTLAEAVFNHSALLNDRSVIVSPAKEDSILLRDADGGTPGYGKATLQSAVFESPELIKNRAEHDEPAGTYEVLVKLADDTFARVKRSNFLGYQWPSYLSFNDAGLVAHTAPVAGDHLLVWDSTASANKKLTLDKLVAGLPAGAAPADAHLIPVHNGSSALGKVTLAALKSYCIAGVSISKSTPTAAMPSYGGTATMAHGLSGKPQAVRVVAVCDSADAGWSAGDEVDAATLMLSTGGYYTSCFDIYTDATNVKVLRANINNLYCFHKSTGAHTAMNVANWSLKAYCVYFA